MDGVLRSPKATFNEMISNPLVDEEKQQWFRRVYHAWSQILENYTKCSLTYVKDKLIAIQGIEKVVQQETGLELVAGLWRQYLLESLLWKARFPGQRQPVYRAPTWSWASVDGEINTTYLNLFLRGHTPDPIAQILETEELSPFMGQDPIRQIS